mgnify:CR=1 FL=1
MNKVISQSSLAEDHMKVRSRLGTVQGLGKTFPNLTTNVSLMFAFTSASAVADSLESSI